VVEAHGLSDPGPVRKTNEDSFISDPELQLFVVADGLGGHSAGEVASSLAVETIAGFIRRTEEDSEFSWPYGIEPELSFHGNRLRTAVHLANRRVFRAAERYDEYTGMGTTVVSALIFGGHLAVASAGDSRLYMFADGRLTQLTRDDTWAATVLAAQGQSATAAHPPRSMRSVLTNVLGAREQADVHISEHDLAGGEIILLCSDGLHTVLDDGALQSILEAGRKPSEIVPRLMEAALANGARDNITAVLARYVGE
jgi:serine/threonine protein phosphatase PrpC